MVTPLTLYRSQGPLDTNAQLHPVTHHGIESLIYDSTGLFVALGACGRRALHHDGRVWPRDGGLNARPCGIVLRHVYAPEDVHDDIEGMAFPFSLQVREVLPIPIPIPIAIATSPSPHCTMSTLHSFARSTYS